MTEKVKMCEAHLGGLKNELLCEFIVTDEGGQSRMKS